MTAIIVYEHTPHFQSRTSCSERTGTDCILKSSGRGLGILGGFKHKGYGTTKAASHGITHNGNSSRSKTAAVVVATICADSAIAADEDCVVLLRSQQAKVHR